MDRSEKTKLSKCEETIEAGHSEFVAVGLALAEIRDSRLYRATHATFEKYCADRLDIKKSQAYRLIEEARAVHALSLSPNGDVQIPKNEGQARELVKAPPERRLEVLKRASAKVGAGALSAKLIHECVVELQPVVSNVAVVDSREAQQVPEAEPKIPTDWSTYLNDIPGDVLGFLKDYPGYAATAESTFQRLVREIRTLRGRRSKPTLLANEVALAPTTEAETSL